MYTPQTPYLTGTQMIQEYMQAPDTQYFTLFGWETFTNGLGGGFTEATLNLVVARSGFGKTNYLIYLACKMLSSGVKIQFFSTEMTRDKILQRMHAHFYNEKYNEVAKLPRGDDKWVKMLNDFTNIGEDFLFYGPQESRYIEDIRHNASIQCFEGGYKMVFIDHLAGLDTRMECKNDLERANHIASTLEKMIEEDKLILICASQFTKGNERGVDNGNRSMDDIVGGHRLRSYTSNILYLYESESQEEINAQETKAGFTENCECSLKLLKARDGWGGMRMVLQYDKARVQFDELKLDFEEVRKRTAPKKLKSRNEA